MIDVKKFKVEHLLNFMPDRFIEGLNWQMAENSVNPTMDIVTLFDKKGKPICFAGINHKRYGVGELWVIRGKLIQENKFNFYKSIRNLIEFTFQHMEIHRLEIAVDVNYPEYFKWAESLGFELEGVQKRYDHLGNDHAIYVRFNNG